MALTNDVVARLSVRDKAAFSRDMQGAQSDVRGIGDAAEDGSGRGLASVENFARMGVVAIAGLVTAAVGVGTALANIGGQFDDAWDTIRVGTGATGDALAVLQDDVRAVRQTTIGELGDVASTVADLNTYLGLSGEPLQNLTSQLLNVSRLTGGDLSTNVSAAARLFGDWSIAAADMEGSVDAAFRASQATGIDFTTLQQNMVTSGVTLRELGFGFEESLALLGNFERQGVNAGQVLGAMRMGLGRLAREGEAPAEAFGRIIDEIQHMDDATAGLERSMEVFGARAGAEMFATIRDGRFDIEDLVSTVTDGEETIAGLTTATNDWLEQWELLKQRGFDALEQPATRVFELLGRGLDWISREAPPIIEELRAAWTEAWPQISSALQTFWGYAEPVLLFLGQTIAWLWDHILEPFVQFHIASWRMIGQAISDNWDTISAVFTYIRDGIVELWDVILVPAYRYWVDTLWPGMMESARGSWSILEAIFGFMGAAITAARTGWRSFRDTVSGVWTAIRDAATTAWNYIRDHVIEPMRSGLDSVVGAVNRIPGANIDLGTGGGSWADTAAPSTAAPMPVMLPADRVEVRRVGATGVGQAAPVNVAFNISAVDVDSFRRLIASERRMIAGELAIAVGRHGVTG